MNRRLFLFDLLTDFLPKNSVDFILKTKNGSFCLLSIGELTNNLAQGTEPIIDFFDWSFKNIMAKLIMDVFVDFHFAIFYLLISVILINLMQIGLFFFPNFLIKFSFDIDLLTNLIELWIYIFELLLILLIIRINKFLIIFLYSFVIMMILLNFLKKLLIFFIIPLLEIFGRNKIALIFYLFQIALTVQWYLWIALRSLRVIYGSLGVYKIEVYLWRLLNLLLWNLNTIFFFQFLWSLDLILKDNFPCSLLVHNLIFILLLIFLLELLNTLHFLHWFDQHLGLLLQEHGFVVEAGELMLEIGHFVL